MQEGEIMDMWECFTPEAKAIILNDDSWSKKHMMESCALCKKQFKEYYVPLYLWKNDGKWSISFHTKCAFGDKVVEFEDEDLEDFAS